MKDLWENFYFWLVVEDPKRGSLASGLAIYGGCGLALAGVFGVFAKGVLNAFNVVAHAAPYLTLESAFPQFSTWWVPETFLGCFLAVGFIGLGWWLNGCVKQSRKFIEC